MPIKLNGATSGSIELDVPAAVGSDLQLTLPATAGEVIVKETDGSVDLGNVDIDSSGNVGIGTTSPGALLTLAASVPELRFVDSDNSLYGTITAPGGDIYIDADKGNGAGGSIIRFAVDDSERARIDSSGRLLVGTTTEGYAGAETFTVANSGNAGITIRSGTAGNGTIAFSDATSGDAEYDGFIQYRQATQDLAFATDSTERMRITSAGAIWVGTSVVQRYNNINTGLWGYDPAGTGTLVFVNFGTAGNGAYQGVGLGKAATSWGTYSDERGKTALVPIENGLSKISTLRAVTGRYIEEEKDVSRSFLIAQDVQAVLPEAVDADNPEKLNLRYTEVIPLLVAALKESKERIETLETKVAALEATP